MALEFRFRIFAVPKFLAVYFKNAAQDVGEDAGNTKAAEGSGTTDFAMPGQ